jgi:hypothetical protein
MSRHGEMSNPAAVVSPDQEYGQHLKANGRHSEEVDGDQLCLSQIRQIAQLNGKQEKCHQVLPPSATVDLTEDKSCPEPRVVPSRGPISR